MVSDVLLLLIDYFFVLGVYSLYPMVAVEASHLFFLYNATNFYKAIHSFTVFEDKGRFRLYLI